MESNALEFSKLKNFSEEFSGGAVLLRVLSGLGFRYYWATYQLRSEDVKFKYHKDSWTVGEILEHFYQLICSVKCVLEERVFDKSQISVPKELDVLKNKTLDTIRFCCIGISKKSDGAIQNLKVRVVVGQKTRSYSIYHLINGQLSDALHHVGQIAILRRMSGNPIDSGVNYFLGIKIQND